jgi:hypothetical protein
LVNDAQAALTRAAMAISDEEKRSDLILTAIAGGAAKENLIPVLAKTGGKKALRTVLDEFEHGNPEIREICFRTLTNWKDYSASSAMYEICISGNKTYEAPAFDRYVKQIRDGDLPDTQKLLLYRKILPWAFSPERKIELLTEIGKLKTYQSLFIVANFLTIPR